MQTGTKCYEDMLLRKISPKEEVSKRQAENRGHMVHLRRQQAERKGHEHYVFRQMREHTKRDFCKDAYGEYF